MHACESQDIIDEIVDWSKLVINIDTDEDDDRDVILEEDAMYEFIGLRAKDDRREVMSKEPSVDPLPPEFEKEIVVASMEVDDNGLEDVEYMDENDPTC
ncbi:hypothetical protein GUJ93_ZPchr0004g40165 [Zizania palustris]|uniref:Uncharacterized protein n=1 Tax=Zizania palustris TaxID=103762 RepID=A0A8J5S031_ZIZPA|nr:hypothetical protein GUJ93_ZPchr0004g40165 [Zizania palustris]